MGRWGLTCRGSNTQPERKGLRRDLSNNNLTGEQTFHVQNNQLTCTLNLLARMPLNDKYSKQSFQWMDSKGASSVPAFVNKYDGKSFDNEPAPPPPPFTPPPPGKSHNNHSRSPPSGTHKGSDAPLSNESSRKKLGIGAILGISLGSAFFTALIALVLLLFCRKGKGNEHVTRPSTVNPPFSGEKVNAEMQEQRVITTASIVDLKRVKSPITTSSYIVATLQTATNSFSQDNTIGEGSLGRVYRADFPNAKTDSFNLAGSVNKFVQKFTGSDTTGWLI
ncbi:hypothetical protein Tco_1127698 [Tanacetum coccineum]